MEAYDINGAAGRSHANKENGAVSPSSDYQTEMVSPDSSVRQQVHTLIHIRIPQRDSQTGFQNYYNDESGPNNVCDTPEPSYKRHCNDNRRRNIVPNAAEQETQADSYEDGEFYPSSPTSISSTTEQGNNCGQSHYNEAEKTEQGNNSGWYQYKEGEKLPDNVCRECFKVFSSVKAVHGHMRTHAERGYRGMNPQPRETATPSPAKSLPSTNWSARERRGRKGSKPHDPQPPRANSVSETAVDLSQYQKVHNSQYQLDTGNPDVGAAIALMMMSDLKTTRSVYGKNKARLGNVEITCNEGNMRAILIPSTEFPPPPSSSGEKIKMKRVDEENKAGVLGKVHKCNTCNKTFSSHQALGGHRASHNKVKASSEGGEMLEETEHAAVHHHGSGVAIAEHRCRLCGDSFPTGQALGGHMRKHLQVSEVRGTGMSGPSPLLSQPPPLQPPPPLPGSGRERGLPFDFNLNNPPSPDDRKEE